MHKADDAKMVEGMSVWLILIMLVSGCVSETLQANKGEGENCRPNRNLNMQNLLILTLEANARPMLKVNTLLIMTIVVLVVAIVILVFMNRHIHLWSCNSLFFQT